MRGRAVLVLGVAMLLGLGVPAARAEPARAAEASCPASPLSISTLMALSRHDGPLAKAYPPGVAWINERARGCYGHRKLRLRAYVAEAGGIGGSSAYQIRPAWFLSPSLIVFASDAEMSPGVGSGTFYGVTVPPGFGDLQRRYAGRWVMLTGAFSDPRSTRCRATGVPGETPSTKEAIAICRSMFVLQAIALAPRMPVTDAVGLGSPAVAHSSPLAYAMLIGMAGLFGLWLGWRRPRRARVRSAKRDPR